MERCPDHMATPIAKPATCEVCDMEIVRTLRDRVRALEAEVLDWIEKARNAEALAANLRRVDNERAIELMRVKRGLVRELDAAWLRHTWPCGHISEGTGDEPDRCRICVAEERARNWKECIADEMAENVKLFDLLGVTPEIEAGRAGTDAVVDAVRRLKAELAATLATLGVMREALADSDGLLEALARYGDEEGAVTEQIRANGAALRATEGRG